jgi:hypothetical protein
MWKRVTNARPAAAPDRKKIRERAPVFTVSAAVFLRNANFCCHI